MQIPRHNGLSSTTYLNLSLIQTILSYVIYSIVYEVIQMEHLTSQTLDQTQTRFLPLCILKTALIVQVMKVQLTNGLQ